MENTYKTASEIVEFLKYNFENKQFSIPTIKNVYITGSFIRGDWLNMSSDLDIQILFHKETYQDQRKTDLLKLQNAVKDQFGNPPFPSQTMEAPFGLDWSASDYLPLTEQEISTITPFSVYNIFYFDFYKNRKLLYGADFSIELPEVIDVKKMIKPTIMFLADRICTSELYVDTRKCAFAAYKIAIILQFQYGKADIDKRNILSLYLDNVPEFSMKGIGEEIIRNYITRYYPDNKPVYFGREVYVEFAEAVMNLIGKDL